MAERIAFGLAWCVVFYFGACMVIGGIIGYVTGLLSHDPAHIEQKVSITVHQIIGELRLYIIIAAVLFSFVGSWKGFLPGTKYAEKASE